MRGILGLDVFSLLLGRRDGGRGAILIFFVVHVIVRLRLRAIQVARLKELLIASLFQARVLGD